MRMLDEMCEVQLQEEVAKLRKNNEWLRNSLIRIKSAIESGDLTYSLAIIIGSLEATKEEAK
jgi:hypothetical protein